MDLKEQGNKFFQLHRFEDAISCYSKAIIKNPEVVTYFTNRALCYIHLKQNDRAVADCRKAVELDPRFVKAHFFLGRSLLAMGCIDEAIKSLSRAHELSKSQKLNYGDEITLAIRQARRDRFEADEEKRIQQEIELENYLTELVSKDKDKRLEKLKSDHGDHDEIVDLEQVESMETEYSEKIDQIRNMFREVDDRRKKREVPDFLCGRISFELMKEPVITPSGITYDKKDIREHLERVGHFDPVSRAPLTADQLTPNLVMQEVIDHFLKDNEWAVDF